MLERLHRYPVIALAPILFLIASPGLRAAPVTVTSFLSAAGPNEVYDFSVTNNIAIDPYSILTLVTLSVPKGLGTIIGSVIPPAGNEADWDPGLGLIDFASDDQNGFPVGTTIDGFRFISPLTLGPIFFSALYLNNAQDSLTTYSGTVNPSGSTVPEPFTFSLFVGAVIFFALYRRRQIRHSH